MKAIHIALLVLAGALGGAVVMKVAQWQHPAAVKVERKPVVVAEMPAVVAPAALAEIALAAPAVTVPPPEPAQTLPAARIVPAHRKERPAALVHAAHPALYQAARLVAPPPQPAPAPVTVAQASPPVTGDQPKETPSVNTPPVNMEPEEVTPLPPQIPSAPEARKVTLNAGMLIPVRLVDGLSLERNQAGDRFAATLYRELAADGLVIAERGARVEGRVVTADRASKTLSIELAFVETSDGQEVAIQTERFDKRGEPDRNGDVAKVGAGAVIGAVIGGIAGGGKGAAIGAGVGGGAGAGDVMLSRKPVALPSETMITFRLRAPVTVRERQ